jgi:RNA polymerase-binding transcription factor DksA
MPRPNAKQIEALERGLLAQRASLLGSAHDALARWGDHPMGELAGEVADAGDESVAALLTDLEHAAVQRGLAAVHDIDAALARIRDGEYAVCVDCGDDIDAGRLAAFPTAKRCIACQSVHEKTYADGTAPTL